MKTTKKLTFSAMAVALATAFMALGSYIEVLDMTVSALASLLVAVIYVEIGAPYTFLVWICTTLTTALVTVSINPVSALWIMYFLLFGIFPILKGYIERLSRPLWLPMKLLFGNAAMALIILGCTFVIGLPMDTELFGLPTVWVWIIFAILVNVAILLYDVFLTVLISFYMQRLHPVLRKFLK